MGQLRVLRIVGEHAGNTGSGNFPGVVTSRVDGSLVEPTHPFLAIRRLDSLTGLRAFAALAVFFDHAQFLVTGEPRSLIHYVGAQGAMGVTFFFCLSGFVLAWSDTVQTRGRFWWARMARIWPAYLVALLGGLIVTLAAGGTDAIVGKLVVTAVLIQAWFPNYDWSFAVNGVSWSLSCEAFFYLLFPFLLVALRRSGARLRYAFLIGTVVFAFATGFVGNAIGGSAGTWFTDTLPVTRLGAFVTGIVLALEVKNGRFPAVNRFGALGLAVVVYLAGSFWLTRWTNAALPVVPFALLIAAYAQRDLTGHRTVFARPRVVWLGEISFCFYLVHQLVIRAATPLGITSGVGVAILRTVACLSIAVVAAWVLHRAVELPANTWLRRRGPGRNARSGAAPRVDAAFTAPGDRPQRAPAGPLA